MGGGGCSKGYCGAPEARGQRVAKPARLTWTQPLTVPGGRRLIARPGTRPPSVLNRATSPSGHTSTL